MDEEDVCRICRGEGTEEEPLCHPCGCSGSIKYVHQDCIQEWLKNTRVNTKCDLCGVPYTIGKIYDQQMPDKLPLRDYIENLANNWRYYASILGKTVRAFALVFILLEWAGYSMEFVGMLTSMPDLSDVSGALQKMKTRATMSPPPKSVAPIIDWVFSFIFPEQMWRTVMINGLCTICAMVAVFLVMWTVYLWISDEPIVIKEANRIRHGNPSLFDMGMFTALQELVHQENDDNPVLAHLPDDLAMRVRNNPDYQDYLRRLAAREQMFAGNVVEEVVNGEVVRRQPRRIPNQFHRDLYTDTEIDSDDFDPVDAIDAEEAAIDGNEPVFIVALYTSLLDWFGGDWKSTMWLLGAVLSLVLAGIFACVFFPHYTFGLYFSLVYQLTVQVLRHLKWTNALNLFLKYSPRRPTSLSGNLVMYICELVLSFALWRWYTLLQMNRLLKTESGREMLILSYKLTATIKSVIIVSVELLAFPIFVGMLLHLITLPLLQPVSWHQQMFALHPVATAFVQWCVGLAYLRATMMLVICLRKCFRDDVLYFVHEAKTIDLIRHIIVTPVSTQIKSLTTSAMIHATSTVVGLGSFNLMILAAKNWQCTFSINKLPQMHTVLNLWPMIIMAKLYTCKLDHSIGSYCSVVKLWAKDRIWLIATDQTAKILDLSSWFFAQHRPLSEEETAALARKDTHLGYFVRAPAATKNYKTSEKKMFTAVNQFDDRLDGEIGVLDDELKEYVTVWRPPHFWLRMSLMFVAIWAVIIMLFSIVSVVPYQAGKLINSYLYANQMENDMLIWAYGLCVCFPIYGAVLIITPPWYLSISKRFKKLEGSVPRPSVENWDKAVPTVLTYAYLYAFTRSPELWNLFKFKWGVVNFAANMLAVYLGSVYWNLIVERSPTTDFLTFHAVAELLNIIPNEYSIGNILRLTVCGYHLFMLVKRNDLFGQLEGFIRESKYSMGTVLYDYEPPAK